jgi:hypothetical protein
MGILLSTVAMMLVSAFPAIAGPSIDATFPDCIAGKSNSVVKVTLTPENGWALVRVYFRATNEVGEYYMEMRSAGNGSFFAVLPKPLSGTTAVEMYVLARDAEGLPLKTEATVVNVTDSCKAELTPEEQIYAQNLVIGNTLVDQEEKTVVGFMCDGIVSRIDLRGALRPDEQCRRVLMAAGSNVLIPALALGAAGAAAIIIEKDDKEPNSPSR